MDSASYQKKKIAETLPMQNASASTHEAGVSQSSNMKVPQPETVVKQNSATDSDSDNSGVRYSAGAKTDKAAQKTGDGSVSCCAAMLGTVLRQGTVLCLAAQLCCGYTGRDSFAFSP